MKSVNKNMSFQMEIFGENRFFPQQGQTPPHPKIYKCFANHCGNHSILFTSFLKFS